MATTIRAKLVNATNHRNVFTIRDMVVDEVIVQNRNFDVDEFIFHDFERDDSDIGHVSWEIKGQVANGSPTEIRQDDESINMD